MSTPPVRHDTIIKGWQKKDRDVKVARIYVTAHNQPHLKDPTTGKTLLHWRVNAAYDLSGADRSVSYDTLKESAADPIIWTTIDSKAFLYSSKSPYVFLVEMGPASTTTTDIAQYLDPGKFGAYKYDGNGSGCLYWCRALIEQLQTDGRVKAGSHAALEVDIAKAKHEDKYWIPDDKGTFF